MVREVIVLVCLASATVSEANVDVREDDAFYQVVTNRLLVQTRVSKAVKYAERLERKNGVSRETLTEALERAIRELRADQEVSYKSNLRWMAIRLLSELAPQTRIEALARVAEEESGYCARTAFEGYYRRCNDDSGLDMAERLLERHKSPGVMRGAVWSTLSEDADRGMSEEKRSRLRALAERRLECADDVVDADLLLLKICSSYRNGTLRKSVRERVVADRSGRYSPAAKRHFSSEKTDVSEGWQHQKEDGK